MRINSTRRITIIPLVAFALLTLCFFQPRVLAGEPPATPAYTLSSNSGSTGFVYGQTLRFSALNPDNGQQSVELLRVRIKLTDANGTVLAQSAEVTISAGKFHSFDFKRDDLHLPGEPGTGRLQIAWIVEASTQGNSPHAFPLSIEIVDNNTGVSSGSQVKFVYLSMPQN